MLALLDADSIIFSCGFAVQHKEYVVWQPDAQRVINTYSRKRDIPSEYKDFPIEVHEDIEPVENCLHLVKQKIESILDAVEATEKKIFIKGKGNFREEIAKTKKYKGNRDTLHRPIYEPDIRHYLKTYWGAEEVDGMEADDAVAIEQEKDYGGCWELNRNMPDISIICTGDKDLNQIPGWHYDYIHNKKYWVTEEEASKFFYQQLLSGDPSDNIVGVAGIGTKIAQRLLKDCKSEKEMYQVVKEQYKKVYKDKAEEILNEMANLLWILREKNDRWNSPK